MLWIRFDSVPENSGALPRLVASDSFPTEQRAQQAPLSAAPGWSVHIMVFGAFPSFVLKTLSLGEGWKIDDSLSQEVGIDALPYEEHHNTRSPRYLSTEHGTVFLERTVGCQRI